MTQQINLLDARLRPQQRHFSAAAVLAGLAAVLALCVVFQQLYAWQNRSLQAALAQMDARAAPLREQLVRFAKEFGGQGSSAALNDEIARVEEALRARRALLGSMRGGPGEAEGFSHYLAALARQRQPGVWLTGIQIDGALVLRGRALDGDQVPAYIRGLNREEAFAGRAVSELRMAAQPEKQLEFLLSIPLGKGPS